MTPHLVDSEWTYVAPSPQSLTPFGGYYARRPPDEACQDRPPIKARLYDDGPLPPSTWFDDGYARASRTHPGKLRHHGFEAGWEPVRVDRTAGFKTWNWLGRHVVAYTEHPDVLQRDDATTPNDRLAALDQRATPSGRAESTAEARQSSRAAESLGDYFPRERHTATPPREAPAPARPLSAASFV